MHSRRFEPPNFGKKAAYRFDPPDSSYGVMYAGEDPECCFIECLGGTTGTISVSGAYIAERHLAEFELTKNLELIDLLERGKLNKVGADQRLVSELTYDTPQRWSAALRSHPMKASRIRYGPRHAAL